MNYPILTDYELIIIHNRTKEVYDKFFSTTNTIRYKKNVGESVTVPENYFYSGKQKSDQLDLHNVDYEIYKSIIAINELHRYLNEKEQD